MFLDEFLSENQANLKIENLEISQKKSSPLSLETQIRKSIKEYELLRNSSKSELTKRTYQDLIDSLWKKFIAHLKNIKAKAQPEKSQILVEDESSSSVQAESEQYRTLGLKEVFDYYTSKDKIVKPQYEMFDEIQQDQSKMHLSQFTKVVLDFGMRTLPKYRIKEVFNKSTKGQKYMDLPAFLEAIDLVMV